MTIEETLRARRAEILRIAEQHGAYDLRVFGSAARGEAKPESDIDLLVKARETTSPWFPVGLAQDLEDLLGCKVDVLTEGALHWYIRDRILREAVVL